MAKTNFIPGINRRELLATAAAASTAGIAPTNLRVVNAGALPGVASLATTAPGKPADLTTLALTGDNARRFAEIAARNRIRHDGLLPEISVPAELRKLYRRDREAAFERFAVIHRDAIKDDLLAARRRAKAGPAWQPRGFFERGF
ncbi:MAG TPA: hypothetical protein VGG11_19125 [Xanthobacteraceae bacterium]